MVILIRYVACYFANVRHKWATNWLTQSFLDVTGNTLGGQLVPSTGLRPLGGTNRPPQVFAVNTSEAMG